MRWNRNSLSKSYSKGEESYSQNGKMWRKREIPAESRCGDQVPNKCVTSLNTHCLVRSVFLVFLHTKLDLICRNKYCCSQSINLVTKFAGHSYIKSSKGELLHRSVRLERELIDQVN